MFAYFLFASIFISNQLATGQRYVCYDQPCVADINNASPQCHKFCNDIGYTFGHCANRTAETDETRDIPRRQKRQAPQDLIASILSSNGKNANSSSNRGPTQSENRANTHKSEAEVHNWTKEGNQCQCYSCDKSRCDKYCETKDDINCLALGQMLGINMEICACGIDTSSSENLLEIIDTLC